MLFGINDAQSHQCSHSIRTLKRRERYSENEQIGKRESNDCANSSTKE